MHSSSGCGNLQITTETPEELGQPVWGHTGFNVGVLKSLLWIRVLERNPWHNETVTKATKVLLMKDLCRALWLNSVSDTARLRVPALKAQWWNRNLHTRTKEQSCPHYRSEIVPAAGCGTKAGEWVRFCCAGCVKHSLGRQRGLRNQEADIKQMFAQASLAALQNFPYFPFFPSNPGLKPHNSSDVSVPLCPKFCHVRKTEQQNSIAFAPLFLKSIYVMYIKHTQQSIITNIHILAQFKLNYKHWTGVKW